MADYTSGKPNIGSVYPEHAIDAQEFSRVEPLVTPDQLRRRFLFRCAFVFFYPRSRHWQERYH